MTLLYWLAGAAAALILAHKVYRRLQLSKAKHPSLRGHSKMSRRLARLLPFYEFSDEEFFSSDGAPVEIADARRAGFERLSAGFLAKSPESIRVSSELESVISDVNFTNHYRVPFQFRNYVRRHMKLGTIAVASTGVRIQDLDGNWSHDVFGSYGVNVFGVDFYRDCIDNAVERARDLGPVLGPYHPVIADNVTRLKAISGKDEVSFHMSGTEAVMQAVRLATYHTERPRVVVFCGAYHGWWDGVQPGIGSVRKVNDVYTLKEHSADTLRVLRTRNDIACVLVNPLQAMHPNGGAPGDATLIASDRSAAYDKQAHTEWLQELREVCTERGIVLIFDEVFVGFRLAYRGAQEYFGIDADMVTYGKTLGGGFPVGVVCGRRDLMKRFREDRPSDVCFARGTFNSHPYVMTAMNEFLQRVAEPDVQASYENIDDLWDSRVATLNDALAAAELPVKFVNMVSVWTILYTVPSRYNWMLQFYLRSQGLSLSWVGSGRFIMSHNYTDEDFAEVVEKIVAAATEMRADGWWWQGGGLSNKSIKRQVLKEMLLNRL